MGQSGGALRERVLAFTSIAEAGTGVGLCVVPALVGNLLLGVALAGPALDVARVAGLALLSLGVACWPRRAAPGPSAPAALAMTIYNVLVAAYLGYVGAVEHESGVLLWPAVVLHAAVALALIVTRRDMTGSTATAK